MLTAEIAEYLADQGLGTFDPSGTSGDIFLAVMPDQPTQAMALYDNGGAESPMRRPIDDPNIQVITRGGQHPEEAHALARDVYDTLHGFTGELPGYTWVVWCIGIQSGPVPLGPDENGRHRYSLNFRLRVHAPTAHRA